METQKEKETLEVMVTLLATEGGNRQADLISMGGKIGPLLLCLFP